jgi:hypothetical protein
VSTSPYGAARAAAPAGTAGREVARASHAFDQFEDTWVTVFGFSQSDLPLVIREFSKAGDIQQVGGGRDGGGGGWGGLKVVGAVIVCGCVAAQPQQPAAAPCGHCCLIVSIAHSRQLTATAVPACLPACLPAVWDLWGGGSRQLDPHPVPGGALGWGECRPSTLCFSCSPPLPPTAICHPPAHSLIPSRLDRSR